MTHEELYNILDNNIQFEKEEINLMGKWSFQNQVFILENAKDNNEVLNIEMIKKIFNFLNNANTLFAWGVQNYNVEE